MTSVCISPLFIRNQGFYRSLCKVHIKIDTVESKTYLLPDMLQMKPTLKDGLH